MPSAREAAFQSLERCEKQKKYSNLEIDSTVKRLSFDKAEKNLYVSLVYGVIERMLTLDFIIDCLASRKREDINTSVLISIRLGLYQIIFLDKIPNNAAVDESVKLSKAHAGSATGGFTNAVLRSFLRACSGIDYKNINNILSVAPFKSSFDKLDKYSKMSVLYSYPIHLCRLYDESYPEINTCELLEAMNKKGKLTLRVNTLKTTRRELEEMLESRCVSVLETEISPFGLEITSGSISEISDLIDDGLVFVQDEASQIAAMVLDAKENEFLIDCCACPGGKSFSSGILMKNKGKIVSCDLHKSKLSLIDSGAKRLGLDIIETLEADSSKNIDKYNNCADKVLCDVPCSGLGVISKKPEIRYKALEDIKNLPTIQRKILDNCSKYVKAHGVLVYSTCTLNPAENQNNVTSFLANNPEFVPYDFEFISNSGQTIKSSNGMLTLFGHINNTDGFFISRMKRK